MLTARRGCCRPAPVLGPDPSLVIAGSRSPHPLFCPSLSKPPRLDSALPTGALTGSVPRPTQTLNTGQGQVQGGEGTTNQSSSCPSRGTLWTASPGQQELLLVAWEGREGQWRVQSPPPQTWWEPALWGAGHCCLVRLHGPGMHMAAHTGPCMGGGWVTLHRTDTQSSR